MGIDKPNYNIRYMKQILNALRESKEMANRPENNARNQKVT